MKVNNMVTLREITVENFWDVISLCVSPEQEKLVLSNAVSIAQSKVQPECIPLAIYSDEELVGFLMYCVDRDDNEYWLYRIMIDQRHQGKGYGRQAMEQVIGIMERDKDRHRIYLGVHRDGGASVKLYESLGFVFTGDVYGEEHIMMREY